MHVIAKETLVEFWNNHKDAEEALKVRYYETEHAAWNGPSDIKEKYRSADFLPGNLVVFNIKDNNYRLIIKVNYHSRTVFIRYIGTHAEYDRYKAENT